MCKNYVHLALNSADGWYSVNIVSLERTGTSIYLTHPPLPGQNGRHFKRIFLNENAEFRFQFSLKFVPKGPIDNKSALVQAMAWRRTGDKPLPEPVLIYWTNTDPVYRCIYASLGGDEFD